MRIFFSLSIFLCSVVSAVVTVETPFKVRQLELELRQELPVYKDPSLFLPNVSEMYSDPHRGWESLMEQSPLLTTLSGKVCLLKLAPPTPFKNFGAISRMYEIADPRLRTIPRRGEKAAKAPLIVPVQLCGENAYTASLGFVLLSDLQDAKHGIVNGNLPPSVAAIPTFKE